MGSVSSGRWMGLSKGPGVALTPADADNALFLGLVGLLVWAPLPLGSNRPWWSALMVLWVLMLLGLWLLGSLRKGWPTTPALRRAWPMLTILGVWVAYGLVQMIPLPRAVLAAVSPGAVRLYADAGVTGVAPLTLDLHASLNLWIGSVTYLGLFALILLLVRTHRRLWLLCHALVLAALAQSMLASLVALSGVDVWFVEANGAAHGTFPNRNHLAGFLEMGIAIGIGLLMAELGSDARQPTWRQRLRNWLRTLLGRKARLRIYLAIMVVTLVLTGSRMGNSAFFGSLLIASMVTLLFYRSLPRSVLVLMISLVLVDLFILGSWFGLDRVRERLERTVLTEETRYHVDVQGLGYVQDYWLTGSGGGTFMSVFTAYRDRNLVPLTFDHAHNDYLEFLLEFGVGGLALLGAAVLGSLVAAVSVLRRRRDPLLRGCAFASLMGIGAILIHSTADFNLRIPANAALFMVLLALPWLGRGLGQRAGPAGPPDGEGRHPNIGRHGEGPILAAGGPGGPGPLVRGTAP